MFECTLLLYTNLRPLTRKGRVVLRIRIDLDDFLAEHWCRYCLLCILIAREVHSHRIQIAVLPPLDEGEQLQLFLLRFL